MAANISDNTYHTLTGFSYDERNPIEVEIQYKNSFETWKTEEKITMPNGFDASVFSRGDEIVVAYRGTEGDKFLGPGFQDFLTDGIYIAGGLSPDTHYNQFSAGEKVVESLKKKHPNANITVTGHSLGGSIASYVAAKEDLEGVTFNAPSVVKLLSEELRRKVESGSMDQKIVNYMHPKDSISAGFVHQEERHIGSTYYIGSTYSYENAADMDNPVKRFYNSAFPWRDDFHGLRNFTFDEDGNVMAPVLYDMLNEYELSRSPRYMTGWVSGTTIELTPDTLLGYAAELGERGMLLMTKHLEANEKLLSPSHIPEAQCAEEFVAGVMQDWYLWYAESTFELENKMIDAAKQFEDEDYLR